LRPAIKLNRDRRAVVVALAALAVGAGCACTSSASHGNRSAALDASDISHAGPGTGGAPSSTAAGGAGGVGGAAAGGAVGLTAGPGNRDDAGPTSGPDRGDGASIPPMSGGRDGATGQGGQSGAAGGAGTTGAAGSGGAAGSAGPSGIIDTHVHFWDIERQRPGDASGNGSAPIAFPAPGRFIYRQNLPADYFQHATPTGITGAVMVEASNWLSDNEWGLELTRKSPAVLGVIGNLGRVLGQSGFAARFDRLKANPRFRGIRIGQDDLPASQAVFDDLARLAAAGLVVDINPAGVTVSDIEALARRLPMLKIIVNHMGPGFSLPITPAWSAGIDALAKLPNVFMKVSALVDKSGVKAATTAMPALLAPAELAIYKGALDAVWETFGEDRLVFGSNWLVSQQYGSIATCVGIVEMFLAGKTPAQRGKLLSGNAMRIYGLGAAASP
jgi:predicted TIM-barrel fold metal-dependent hydrolase